MGRRRKRSQRKDKPHDALLYGTLDDSPKIKGRNSLPQENDGNKITIIIDKINKKFGNNRERKVRRQQYDHILNMHLYIGGPVTLFVVYKLKDGILIKLT